MWLAKECKENGYRVSKKYFLTTDTVFLAWDSEQNYIGEFKTPMDAFDACEHIHNTKQTQTESE